MKFNFRYNISLLFETENCFVKYVTITTAKNKEEIIKEIKNICNPICLRITINRLDTVKMWFKEFKYLLLHDKCGEVLHW